MLYCDHVNTMKHTLLTQSRRLFPHALNLRRLKKIADVQLLKDTIFSTLCLQAEHMPVKLMGAASWMYLIGIHALFVSKDSYLAELSATYLSVLNAAPKMDVEVSSGSHTILLLLYKQLTPTKLRLLGGS